MSIEHRTFSNHLKAKDLNYCDEFFSIKGEKITPSDSFTFNCYEALRDINDFKTNNYSNLFLTKKQKFSNWLESNIDENDNLTGIVTTLEWRKGDKSAWLYFDDFYNVKEADVKIIECKLVSTKSDKLYGNHVFYIKFIDEVRCHICHTFADFQMYLIYDTNGFRFSRYVSDNDYFVYQVEGEKLKLYSNEGETLIYDEANNVLDFVSEVSKDQEEVSVCYIENPTLKISSILDVSWVGYDTSRSITSIDKDKSSYDLESQALIHHQYNRDGGFNFIPLKTNLTYKGNSVRGNNTNYSDDNYPDVDYRTYTAINSGLNQEKGNDNITLSFTFTDQEYEVNGGQTLTFTIDKRNFGELPTLFPHEQININDTKFVKNGAFASSVPYFSDRVKMLQDGGLPKGTPNNATYLCTWLYKKDDDTKPVWLDRYYFPDVITRSDALGEEKFAQSFDNYVTRVTNDGSYKEKIRKETYFDKVSDMLIKEDTSYQYQRVSEKMVNELLDKIESDRIPTFMSNSKKEIDLLDQFLFDGKQHGKIKYNQWKDTNAVNINFDIHLMRGKKMGLQLFGTDYNHGFNIQNRKDLTPFHYYPAENIIYLLNNKFEIVHQFDFASKFKGEKIYKLVLGDVFDDVIVIGNNHLYIFTYDLQLKHRLNFDSDIYLNGYVIKNAISKNWVMYGNNIYIPNGNGILKIVMCPNDKDKSELSTWDYKNQTVALRELTSEEYQSGITDGEVKSIYIDEEGLIYALGFDKYAISLDKETLYGLEKEGERYYISNQTIAKLYGGIEKSKFKEFTSKSSIDMIRINSLGEMCLIRDFEKTLERKRLQVYDKTKQMVFEYDMSLYDTVHSLDSYTFIDENQKEQVCFTIICSSGEYMYRVTYFSTSHAIETKRLSIPSKIITDGEEEREIAGFPYGVKESIFETVNSNRMTLFANENALYFNLNVPSDYIYENKAVIKWSLDNIQNGWYNINVYINLVLGIFEIKINDQIYQIIKDSKRYELKNKKLTDLGDSDITWFVPYRKADCGVFDTTYYIAILGKKYGTLLNKVLKNGVEDPYVCVNAKLENIQIYTKELKYHEYQAMRMRGKKINKLVLTLPCGNRNCIDEIVRYFKYVATQSVSNSIKINIAGTGLETEGQFKLLKKEIMTALENNIDCLIKVRDIEFIETGDNV